MGKGKHFTITPGYVGTRAYRDSYVRRLEWALERICLEECDTNEGSTYGEMCLSHDAVEMAEIAQAALGRECQNG